MLLYSLARGEAGGGAGGQCAGAAGGGQPAPHHLALVAAGGSDVVPGAGLGVGGQGPRGHRVGRVLGGAHQGRGGH